MADYAKIILNTLLSESSDYSDPRMQLRTSQSLTPSAFSSQKITALTSGSTLLDVSPTPFSSIDAVIVQNLDTTNFVTINYFALPSGTTAISNPGGSGFTFSASAKTITDNTSGSKFANVAAGHYLHCNNASNSGNRHNVLVTEKVSAHQVKVGNGTPTDSSNDTSATFTINNYNQQRVSAGGIAVIPGNLLVDTVSVGSNSFTEMSILADTSSCSCNVIIFGS